MEKLIEEIDPISLVINKWNEDFLSKYDIEYNDCMDISIVTNKSKDSFALNQFIYQMKQDHTQNLKSSRGNALTQDNLFTPDNFTNITKAEVENSPTWARLDNNDRTLHIQAFLREKKLYLQSHIEADLLAILTNKKKCKAQYISYDRIKRRISYISILKHDDQYNYYIDLTVKEKEPESSIETGKYDKKYKQKVRKMQRVNNYL
jgi:hypothetical protein